MRTSSCYTWTPASQSWTTAPSLPVGIMSGDMVTTEEKIIFTGGWDGSRRDEILAIDTGLTGQWTQVASLTTARYEHCSVAYNGNIITTGIIGLDRQYSE